MPNLSLPVYRPNVGHIGHLEHAGYGMSFVHAQLVDAGYGMSFLHSQLVRFEKSRLYSASLFNELLRDMRTRDIGSTPEATQRYMSVPHFRRTRLAYALRDGIGSLHLGAPGGRCEP